MSVERIGGYVVEAKLGEGGMGTVYLARSRGGRAVAVKVAKPELASDPEFRARFRAEVTAARAVGGFHTAPVVNADPDGDPPWLATAYIPGPTLTSLLKTNGPMGEDGLRRLGAALAEALEAIHACGLVHRDLKPGNIIMAADGPRVLDFGIARAIEYTRMTATGASFGTPGFLAPEQALGHEVTGAADVFALGAVLTAAAGGAAWGDGTPMSLMYRAVHQPPDLSALPTALRSLVASCLAKDPSARPTPAAILNSLTEVHDEPTRAAPAGRVPARAPATIAAPVPAEPLFIAADHIGAVAAGMDGLTFVINDTAAEFGWHEIRKVECARSTPGKRLQVSVTLTDRSKYVCEVTARRSAEREAWISQLESIVARYLP